MPTRVTLEDPLGIYDEGPLILYRWKEAKEIWWVIHQISTADKSAIIYTRNDEHDNEIRKTHVAREVAYHSYYHYYPVSDLWLACNFTLCTVTAIVRDTGRCRVAAASPLQSTGDDNPCASRSCQYSNVTNLKVSGPPFWFTANGFKLQQLLYAFPMANMATDNPDVH